MTTRIVVAHFSIMTIVDSRIRIMNTSIMMSNDVTTLHPVTIIPIITTYVTIVATHRNPITAIIISIYNNMRNCNNDSRNPL